MNESFGSIKRWFDQCVELPEADREAWIASHVADASDRAILRGMLAADSAPGELLDLPLAHRLGSLGDATETPEATADARIGQRFGPFRITGMLGRGGQGAVFLAERADDEFTQRVAIKVLHRWLADPDQLRRFRRERELLASFEHPGVARLIDGGVGDDGLPYLVMEYVDGEALDAYCTRRGLSLRERLSVFLQLCRVVADAHRALIVHRDLKPANVLVTAAGAVKVLDFGIARMLDDDDRQNSRIVALTPGYGAPEQRIGGRITAATDVHALGVMLRELCTGQAPPTDDRQPVAPWPHALPLELRWIVERASASADHERYRDAAALAEDVDNFIMQRPVAAHPPSAWYRARKFIARHRGGVSLTALLVITTLVSLASTAWQAQVANRQAARAEAEAAAARAQAQRAETVRTFLVELFESAKEVLPRNQRPTPEQLVASARTQLDHSAGMSDALKADLLAVLAEVSLANDDTAVALELLDRQRALSAFATDPGIDRLWAAGLRAQAALQRDQAERIPALLAPFEAEIAQRSDRRIIAILESRIAGYMLTAQREAALRDSDLLARRAAQVVPALDPGDAIYYASMPGLTRSLQGDHAGALPLLQSAIAQWHAQDLPRDLIYTNLLNAVAVSKHGLGAPDLGAAELNEVLALRRQILTSPHELLISVLRNHAIMMRRQQKMPEAEQSAREAAQMADALYGPTHRNAMAARGTLATMLGVGAVGQRDESIRLFRELVAICNTTPEQRDNTGCITYQHNLAHQLSQRRDFGAASAALDGAEVWARRLLGDAHFEVGSIQIRRGVLLLDMNRPQQALDALSEGERRYVGGGQASHATLWPLHFTRARALRLLSRPEEALAASSAAQALVAERSAPNPNEADVGAMLHALLLAERGDLNAAHALARDHRAAFPHPNWLPDEAAAIERLLRGLDPH